MSWKTIYKTGNSVHAEIVKSILTEKGLSPVLINKKDSAYLFGTIEVQVNVEEVLTAIRLIENIRFE